MPDLGLYRASMEKLNARSGGVLREFRKRIVMRDAMQALADQKDDQTIAMSGAQKTALLEDQVTDTQVLQAPLIDAVEAIGGNESLQALADAVTARIQP